MESRVAKKISDSRLLTIQDMIPLRDNIPSRSYPLINIVLIWANFICFAIELAAGDQLPQLLELFGAVPVRIVHWQTPADWLPLLTSMFLHGGWMHLLGNMLFLWIFGDNVEDRMGHGRYLIFYLATGVIAGLSQVVMNPGSDVPGIGASGAIAGVMGAYYILFPRARVTALVFWFLLIDIVELPAVFYIGLWFFIQFFNGFIALPLARWSAGGVAWWAHIGGFVAGFLLVHLFKGRRVLPRYRDEFRPY